MNYSNLNKEYVFVLKSTANCLFKAGLELSQEDINWTSLMEESRKQAVCSIVFEGIEDKSIIPEDISNLWFNYLMIYLRNNVLVNSNHYYLDKLLKNNNITYCILKGAASEYYYPKPSLRAMGDVDFLVPIEDFEKVSELLINEGFSVTLEEHECHKVFKKDKMHLEMHFEPAGMPDGENRKIAEEYFSDIYEKASYDLLEGINFMNPSPFHHGLVMILHTYHHLLSEGIGLRHLCDWAVFVNSFSNDEFVELFKERLERVGLWKFAQILSATACDYIGLPYKKWIGNIDKEITFGIISDIFEGGNFGRKDRSRIQEGMMISNRGKDGIKDSKLFQLIKIKNKQAKEIFRIIQIIPLLYPFGFVFMAVRYAFNVATGKRSSMNIKKLTNNAEKRKNLYSKFELFDKKN